MTEPGNPTAQTAEPTPEVGQIWREVDPREDRHIRIVAVAAPYALVITVDCSGSRWLTRVRARHSNALLSRFNGKRGGYTFVEAAP